MGGLNSNRLIVRQAQSYRVQYAIAGLKARLRCSSSSPSIIMNEYLGFWLKTASHLSETGESCR
jgi:hypothetical protein